MVKRICGKAAIICLLPLTLFLIIVFFLLFTLALFLVGLSRLTLSAATPFLLISQKRSKVIEMSTKNFANISVRYLYKNAEEFSSLVDIESRCFDTPWTRSDFVTELKKPRTSCYVAIHDGKIIGYAVCRFSSKKIQIVNIAVDPEMQRQGIGTSLIHVVVGKLNLTCNEMVSSVRETNLKAQLFFRDCGFKAVEVKRGYHDDTLEDAFIFKYTDD